MPNAKITVNFVAELVRVLQSGLFPEVLRLLLQGLIGCANKIRRVGLLIPVLSSTGRHVDQRCCVAGSRAASGR